MKHPGRGDQVDHQNKENSHFKGTICRGYVFYVHLNDMCEGTKTFFYLFKLLLIL